MKVKDLIKLLKKFKNASILIKDKPLTFEAYQDEKGKLIINLKIVD